MFRVADFCVCVNDVTALACLVLSFHFACVGIAVTARCLLSSLSLCCSSVASVSRFVFHWALVCLLMLPFFLFVSAC